MAIEQEIARLQEEMEEYKAKTVEIDETIKSLHEDIMDAGGMDLRLQKIVVDDVRKRINGLNNKITKSMVAKAKAEKDVTKLESTIKKAEREFEKLETDLKELEQESKRKAKEASEVMKEVEKHQTVVYTRGLYAVPVCECNHNFYLVADERSESESRQFT
ncbi:uncharacterized protein BYT42DRAFT_393047 [Radiomyces spectabilis]|uniref:uncharacterized protein n=1 Tax=Radiomyces spectabilis TaxID=64574 RepID=UPI002220798F|nr:uncharacterized protein BYT42DRAFT_393047 [Radiomyces spectabilis]KAI8374155.1 hypothetical protein BYT42DRAFT_393047 [Radiomyces spectabilis]